MEINVYVKSLALITQRIWFWPGIWCEEFHVLNSLDPSQKRQPLIVTHFHECLWLSQPLHSQ